MARVIRVVSPSFSTRRTNSRVRTIIAYLKISPIVRSVCTPLNSFLIRALKSLLNSPFGFSSRYLSFDNQRIFQRTIGIVKIDFAY